MKVVVNTFSISVQKNASKKLRCSYWLLGPERFNKLREAYSKNFHLVAPLKTSVVTSYDQKTKKVNE